MRFLQEIFSWKIIITSVLAGAMTFICWYFEFIFQMQIVSSLFFVGIFFAFGILMNTANKRRFQTFDEIAHIKANLLTLAEMANNQEKISPESIKKIIDILQNIFPEISKFFREEGGDLYKIDKNIGKLELVAEIFRKEGMKSPEISRIHQFVSQINFSLEKCIVIKEHRTPKILQMFVEFSLMLSIFILAPAFAAIGLAGIIASFIVAIILTSLVAIQQKIENPFRDSIDDVRFKFVERLHKRLERFL